jgi:hypothetical protein
MDFLSPVTAWFTSVNHFIFQREYALIPSFHQVVMNYWILLSLIAMLASTAKVLCVKLACRDVDSSILVLSSRIFAAVCLLPVIMKIGFPTSPLFWIVVAVTALLTAFASVIYTESVKKGPLELVMPAQALIPVFMLIVMALSSGKLPSKISSVFIILTAIALALMLYFDSDFKKSASSVNLYAILSLVAAAIFGITTVLDRTAIAAVANGAIAYSACWNFASIIVLATYCAAKKTISFKSVASNHFGIIAFSMTSLAAFFFQQYAVQKSLDVAGGVVNVKTIVMLHLPIVVICGSFLIIRRRSPLSITFGLLAITFGIALINTL